MSQSLLSMLRAQRNDVRTQIEGIANRAVERGDDLTEAEQANSSELQGKLDKLDERIQSLTAAAEREAAAAAVLARAEAVDGKPTEVRVGGAQVKKHDHLYRQDSDFSFLRDAYNAQFNGDQGSMSRLATHRSEAEKELRDRKLLRDTTTAAYASLIPPIFAVDEYAPIIRAGRPTANIVRSAQLPSSGMVVTVPRATTGSAVTWQATQNAAPTEQDMVVTDLSVNVVTAMGAQDVSRQSIERAEMNMDAIVFPDLAAAYAVLLDAGVIAGTGATGQPLGISATGGITNVTYTDATPTAPEVVLSIAGALSQFFTARQLPATHIVMHPRRWSWLASATDLQGRPLVVPSTGGQAVNAIGSGEPGTGGGIVGSLLGYSVVADPNIRTNLGAGTNEDEVLILRAFDQILWEVGDGVPRQFRFEQNPASAPGTIRLAVYQNIAFTAGRYPQGVARITGTGLIAPAGF